MKKVIVILIILLFPICVLAEEYKELQIVNSSSETKYLENDQGYITKNIIASDAKNGEVTIELEVTNKSSKVESQVVIKENSEIVIVLDESGSMSLTVDYENNLSRFEVINNAAKELVSNLLGTSQTAKIGTISFASDAIITSNLTQNLDDLNTVFSGKRVTNGLTYTTNALDLAETVFSSDNVAKIIIILTDGAPTDDTTKEKLIELSNKGYHIITMLTGSKSSSAFGTVENPTAGKLYLIEDSEIPTIIRDNIFADVIEYIKQNSSITNVTIVDYFPNDITENFEFSYAGGASIGTISEEIDKETKSISWDIGTLKGNEVATIKYKLKLKDMNNETLLNKVINTNEKVVLDYSDREGNTYNVVLDSSPSIKLTNIENIVNYEDETTENPKTGLKDYMIIITGLLTCIGIIIYKLKKKKYITNI